MAGAQAELVERVEPYLRQAKLVKGFQANPETFKHDDKETVNCFYPP
jgi:hypothetical protein